MIQSRRLMIGRTLFVFLLGSSPIGNGLLCGPGDLYVDQDKPNGAIFTITPTGMQAPYTTAPSGVKRPLGLVFAANGDLYQADGNAQIIYVYRAGSTSKTVYSKGHFLSL